MTVLFADLVGSTRLGERLAPEDVKVLVGDCVSRMGAAVEEYGGIVQAYMGDGICAYFGVPRAREDDAERAAQAALKILELVTSTRRDVASAWGIDDLDVRIGINTGWAAVGLVGGAQPDLVALGDTTNVAARLQSAAAPGEILIGEATAKRLNERFGLEPRGPVRVRGRDGDVEARALTGLRRREPSVPRTPLVGRDTEVARLGELLRELESGRGRILAATGEAGIGKTRLLTELRVLAGDAVTWLGGECRSYRGLPYLPFVEVLRGWLGAPEGEVEIAVRTKARARIGALLPDRDARHFSPLARLLGLRDPTAAHEGRSQSTTTRTTEIHEAYRAWLSALAAQRPVVLVLEDVQWLDASSRALAESVLALTDHEALLVAMTLRGGDEPSHGSKLRLHSLGEYAHRTVELPLRPLPEPAATLLLGMLQPDLAEETRAELVRQAEGNPLYLEELARALAETGEVARARSWTITVGRPLPLPASLESLLVARVDLLPDPARQLVEAAAVIGKTFPLRVLERLVDTSSLEADLAPLLRAHIIEELHRYPEREYRFTHGLLQEVVLSTLPAARRKTLYRHVAAVVDELFPDELERLAHYHAQSDQPERAREFLESAAARAAALGAVDEALESLERASRLAADSDDEAAAARIDAELERLRAEAG